MQNAVGRSLIAGDSKLRRVIPENSYDNNYRSRQTSRENSFRSSNDRDGNSRGARISALNLKVKEMLHQPAKSRDTSRSLSVLHAIANKKPNVNPYESGNFGDKSMIIQQNMG